MEPWNKGKKGVYSSETKEKMRIAKLKNPTKFWTGKLRSEETKKKISISNTGRMVESHNPSWKGDKVGYHALHKWVHRKMGYPKECAKCKIEAEKKNGRWNIHWANISKMYKREIGDWIGLCRKCHWQFDS